MFFNLAFEFRVTLEVKILLKSFWTISLKSKKTIQKKWKMFEIQSNRLHWMNHWFSATSSRMAQLKATYLDDISCVSLRQWWVICQCIVGIFWCQLSQWLLSSVHAKQCVKTFDILEIKVALLGIIEQVFIDWLQCSWRSGLQIWPLNWLITYSDLSNTRGFSILHFYVSILGQKLKPDTKKCQNILKNGQHILSFPLWHNHGC